MARSQQAVLSVLGGASGAEHGVRDVVDAQLAWVQEHAGWLGCSTAPADEVPPAAEPSFGKQNRHYQDIVGGWARAQAEQGALATAAHRATTAANGAVAIPPSTARRLTRGTARSVASSGLTAAPSLTAVSGTSSTVT